MLVPIGAGTLGWARPLLVPSGGQDGGEVMCLLGAVRLRREEGIVADPGLSVWPSLPSLAGPRSFGPLLAGVLRATSPDI